MCEKCAPDALTRYATEGIPEFDALSRARRNNIHQILDFPEGVTPRQNDRWEVRQPGRPFLRIVRWRAGNWTCDTCSGSFRATNPCLHMIVVFRHLGLMRAPEVIVEVGKGPRDQAAFDAGKRNMAQEFPALAAKLCATVRPSRFNPIGREAVPASDLMFGAIRYVESGKCLRETESLLKQDYEAGRISRPYSYTLLSEYLAHPSTTAELDRLLLTTFIATSHYAKTAGMDGTGFQRRNYYQYAEDRQRFRRDGFKADPKGRRYLTSVPAIVYETNIVPAVATYSQSIPNSPYGDDLEGLRGETPYFMALMERIRPFFPGLQRVRTDMGFFKRTHFLWGECWGIDVKIPFPSSFKPVRKRAGVGAGPEFVAAARAFDAWHADPTASWKEYHKRSQQEGMMNGVKVEFGGGLQTRTEESQVNEIRLKWLAFNLKQTIYLMHKHSWAPDYQAAAERLGPADLKPLAEVAAHFKERSGLKLYHEAIAEKAAAEAEKGSAS